MRRLIENSVHAVGLEFLGVVPLGVEEGFSFFERWIASGKHAEMAYLANNMHCRRDPRLLLPGARTAIILGLSYNQGDSFRRQPGDASLPVAQYARLGDYHRYFKAQAQQVVATLQGAVAESHQFRVLVDSAPLLERALAAKTSRGFIGKNTLYIHPEKGSFLLLGEILATLPMPVDSPSSVESGKRSDAGGCGSCRRCQVYCPTGALDEAYTLDARKCLSYYTIEHRGTIPVEYWSWLPYSLFGCDICQLVCPYNRLSEKPGSTAGIKQNSHLVKITKLPPLPEMVLMDQSFYVRTFGGTPMTRAKKAGLQRNALIAMIVENHPELAQVLADSRLNEEPLLLATTAQISEYRALKS